MATIKAGFQKIQIVLLVLVPFAGAVYAGYHAWGWGVEPISIALLVSLYFITGQSITIGFHRLFTHRSFQTHWWIEVLFGICGSMAIEGPPDTWVARHWQHHAHADEPADPHSPHHHKLKLPFLTWFQPVIDFLWAHFLFFLFEEDPDTTRFAKHIRQKPHLMWVSRQFPVWVIVSLALPAVIGGLVSMSWYGAWLGFLWGGLVRIFFVHHATWSVNSICHMFGYRNYETEDESRNNLIVGWFSGGEGFHNNHHKEPPSARHGLKWYELDYSYGIIKAMELVGLAWKVNVPKRI